MPEGGVRTSLTPPNGIAVRYGANSFYGPGTPQVPITGTNGELRGWDFPVGVNTNLRPRNSEPFTFAHLRSFSNVELVRLAIETRKDQLEKQDWQIKFRGDNKVARESDSRIEAIEKFFAKPDGMTNFGSFMRQLDEDLLAIDAMTVELRRTRGGQLTALEIVPGDTINLLVDDNGRRPNGTGDLAFQQIIRGAVWANLTNRDLLYFPRNVRPGHIYGFGPVEQIIVTINTLIRRQASQLGYFTEGNVPAGLMTAPEGWQNNQIKDLQDWFDDKISGNQGEQRKLVWGPFGSKYQAFKDSPIKDEFDEWLARVVSFAFSLPPTPWVRAMNKGTAGEDQERALEEGLEPIKLHRKRFIDQIIETEFNAPDLEFVYAEERTIDAKLQMEIDDKALRNGSATIDEVRDRRGEDPLPDGLGNVPRVYLGAAVLPVDIIDEMAKQGLEAAATAAAMAPQKDVAVGGSPADGKAPVAAKDGKAPADKGSKKNFGKSTTSELGKYSDDQARDDHGRWTSGGGDSSTGPTTAQGLLQQQSDMFAQLGHTIAKDQWLLANGEQQGPALKVKAADIGTQHQCYMNAYQAATSGKFGDEWAYTEGVVTLKDIPLTIDHAWLSNEAGQVMDVTIKDAAGQSYFGVPFKTDYVMERAGKTGYYGIISSDVGANREIVDNPVSSDNRAWPKPTAKLNKYSDDQPRDDHGRWTNGGGEVSTSLRIAKSNLMPTMESFAAHADIHENIINMTVDGKAIFNPSQSLDLTRAEMPQIPLDVRQDFMSKYNVEVADLPPSEIGPTQNEIDSFKVGLAATGRMGSDTPLVSSDHYIIDGHHHWAGAIVREQMDSSTRLHVYVLDAPRDVILKDALAYDASRGIAHESLGKAVLAALAKYSPDQPRDERGRFGESSGEVEQAGGFASAPGATSAVNNGNFSSEESSAIRSYSEVAYYDINNGLRGGTGLSQTNQDTAALLDSAIAKSTISEDTQLYRGYSGPALAVGQTAWDKGFASTSTSTAIAASFGDARVDDEHSGRVVLAIDTPAGTNAVAVSGRSYDEKEVILGRGSGFKVISQGTEQLQDRYGSKREFTIYHVNYIPPKWN